MKTAAAALLGLVFSALASGLCSASEGPPPVLDPKTYVSPSGAYSLLVNPSDLLGRGPADYQFTKNGKVLWEKRLPFTMWDAAVADNGSVARYGYTHGWRGFAEEGIDAGMGDFIVALLSAEGKILNQETHAREHSRFHDFPPNPLAAGTVLDEFGKRFIIRVCDPDVNRHIEQWWVYDLGSGKRIGLLEPAKFMSPGEAIIHVLDAKALPGTPLVLTHWSKFVYPRDGTVFTLVDRKGKAVWRLDLDDDYDVPNDEDEEDRIQRIIREKGAILSVNGVPAFDICMVKEQQRATFSVKKESDAWQVRETSRKPYVLEPTEAVKKEKPIEYPRLNVETIGVVKLDVADSPKDAGIRNVMSFDFDSKGSICALLDYKAPRLVLVSQEGKILRELRLPVEKIPETARFSNPANVGGSKFVVAMSTWDIGSVAECFLADFDSGSVKKLTDFASPTVEALVGFEDGRFAALTNRRVKYSAIHGLFFFDSHGKRLWKKEDHGYSGEPDDFLSPEDISRYGTDTIAVLDNIRKAVQLFDVRGGFLRMIDLEKTWGREPNYPTDIAEDSDGGFIVYDFNAKTPLVRMDSKGRIKSELVPRFADDRRFRVCDGAKRSPQGRLWTSDGESLLRLDADGVVDRILGKKPALDILSQPGRSTVDANDRLYVSDRRTKTVHVFNAAGKKLGVCVPDAKDLSEISSVHHIAVSPTGEVFVQLYYDNTCVRFGADLKRLGTAEVGLDSVSEEWYFPSSGDLCWIVGYHDIFLVKELKNVVRTIKRRKDGCWLELPQRLSVAPDGSIAVIASSQSLGVSVNTYSPAGDAQTTFSVPFSFSIELAYNGRLICIRPLGETDVFVFEPGGRCLGRFSLPAGTTGNDWNGPYFAAQGKQLWFFDREHLTLHKYKLPVLPDTEPTSQSMPTETDRNADEKSKPLEQDR